jgi:hypothetical protein
MAITDIESNDLQEMGFGHNREGYRDFLGIGTGKQKAKRVSGQVATLTQANISFKEKMVKAYNVIKGNEAMTNTAKRRLEEPNGLENVFLAVRDFGSPTTKKNIGNHLAAVDAYIKYNYAQVPEMDCETLIRQVSVIDADVEAANKVVSAGQGNPTTAAALANVQSKIKKQVAEKDCEKMQEEAEQTKAKEETLSSLSAAAKIGDKQDNTLKYASYGIGGLVVLIAVIMLIRRK